MTHSPTKERSNTHRSALQMRRGLFYNTRTIEFDCEHRDGDEQQLVGGRREFIRRRAIRSDLILRWVLALSFITPCLEARAEVHYLSSSGTARMIRAGIPSPEQPLNPAMSAADKLPERLWSTAMPSDKECTSHADECVRLAGLTDDLIVRDQLLDLAQEWMLAAQRARRSSDDTRVLSLHKNLGDNVVPLHTNQDDDDS